MEPPHVSYKRLRMAPKIVRIGVGVLLVIGGVLGFLPVLGFWMVPLGLAVIFIDTPRVKRGWSRLRQWWRQRIGRRPRAPMP